MTPVCIPGVTAFKRVEPDLNLAMLHIASHVGFMAGVEAARGPSDHSETINDLVRIMKMIYTERLVIP